MFRHKWPLVLFLLLIGLAITGIAYAANTVIDTDNGQVDTNWAVVPVLNTDGDDIGNDNYDLNQVWVTSAPDQSAYYFRVSLVGSGRLPHDYSSFEARLDCNRNGSYQDAVDVVVYYAIDSTSEEVVECQGNDYSQCDLGPEPNHSDTNLASFAEEISSGSYHYEWRADVNNGQANWSQCLGTVNVQFASLNSSIVEQDSSSWQAYNAPTAVELIGFQGNPAPDRQPALPVSAGLLGLFAGAWWLKRFKDRSIRTP